MLAACGVPAPQGAFRNPSVTIASAALFDPARFAGDWQVVGAYGAGAACGRLAERWVPAGQGAFRVTGDACGPRGRRALNAGARMVGPGRIARGGDAAPIWVLWVDADYRIAVIGTPDGSFGRVMARSATPRADLIAAAREVLDFNGYDPAGLRPL
jgi:apolipoprotein D and lipocalin family protein